MSQALLDAIRGEAKPALWANGVKLARAGAAALEKVNGKEHVFRVKPAGRPVAFTVYLTPDDSWECSCDGAFDPCEHVVASAITLAQGGAQVATTAQTWTRLVYRFTKVENGLTVTRELLHADGRVEPLTQSLQSMVANGTASKLQLENGDLLADRVLEKPWRGALPPDRVEGLLGLLQASKQILLEGQPVAFSPEVMLPRVKVVDDGSDIVVTIHADPRVSEVVSPGVARCGDTVCKLGETELTGPWLHALPSVRKYESNQIGELMSRTLPELALRFPIDNYSRRLPRIDKTLEPRIELQLAQMDIGLSVLPVLVYGSPPVARVDGARLVHIGGPMPVRKENAESRVVASLRDVMGLIPGRRTTYSGQELARFVDKLKDWRGGLTGDARRVLGVGMSLTPHLNAKTTLDAFGVPRAEFSLEFEVQGGPSGASVSGDAVLRAWREGLGLVPIEGGGWAPLPQSWLDTNGARVQALLAARSEDGVVANHALPQLAELCESMESPPPAGLEKLKPLVDGFDTLPRATLPEGLTATLRPYQQHGVDWLGFLKATGLGGVLADDMGLGKTLQTICTLEKGSLVVCPTSVLPNWKAELARFRPSMTVNAYHGPSRQLNDADVTITTYALLRLDAEALAAKKWRVVVLDEAQAIKNPDSQATRAAYRLKADLKLAVTGTPLENRLEELWSLMHFTNPGLLGGRREFNEKYGERIESGSTEATQALRKKLAPFILRRLKRDVAPELPPRTEAVRFVTLEDKERAVYDAVHAATRADVVRLMESGGSVLKALEALLRLRQAACHVALVPGQQAKTSSKVQVLVESIVNAAADGHRCLVFSQWTSMLDLIEPELTAAGLSFSRLDGSTSNRGEVTEKFQAADGPTVLLMSLKAGGTGLTLTAADHVFLVDPWWNPQVEAQAADRAYRIGQDKPVFVYRLVSQGTVEERILQLQDKKRALFEAALEGGEGAASLTREDLLGLFA
ncbi:MAG: helicase [Archangium gephyra]|uniref:Helicase n=1 Tax=Archangium gephyra TaxID=48 RepID=A0A2W5TJ35_9BACT|nr:MAG: helicase [Archangium gephyra]